jgi:hypothetical protein
MRCNPYGYATDAGPRHLMGGRYGPEYAGDKMLVRQDGLHGLGICETPANGRYRMVCVNGHAGEPFPLCTYHVAWITAHYAQTCTRCAMPEQSIQIEQSMESAMRSISEAGSRGDMVTVRRYVARLDDLRAEMDDLARRGVIRARQPLRLVEIS